MCYILLILSKKIFRVSVINITVCASLCESVAKNSWFTIEIQWAEGA